MSGRVSSLFGSPVWNRSGSTLRSVGSGNMLLPVPLRTGIVCRLPTCAQGSSTAATEVVGNGVFLLILGAPWSFVHMAAACFASLPPHVYGARVTQVCQSLDTRRVGGSTIFVTCGEFTGLHFKFASCFLGTGSDFIGENGHSGEVAGKIYVRPLFFFS